VTVQFDNSYARLPGQMFTAMPPTPVTAPAFIATNEPLGHTLGFDTADLADPAYFAGNRLLDGSEPLAQVYAGHQFGHWNPQLGDGRAILLGEVVGTDGMRRDIQLKGSGPTPYSRQGDGRAAIGPVIREYIVSEAMHALDVPTTRALAAVMTGETVYRETPLPGAVLTRVAESHIRVGTFQYFAARGDTSSLNALMEHVIDRHYPMADGPESLLEQVIASYAGLIAKWMSLGFIHGVMNTDNVSIAGETIDYGPCAFMDGYNPQTVFSAIDQYGRYAYANQPGIGGWNMAQFATALIPLMPDMDAAIETFTQSVNQFPKIFDTEWRKLLCAKIGLSDSAAALAQANALLDLMAKESADFTQVFAQLGGVAARDLFVDRDAFDRWATAWTALEPDAALMRSTNPQIIPRNHRVAEVITAAETGDFAPFHQMLRAVTAPFAPLSSETEYYARAPTAGERVLRTFCGT